MCKRSLGCNPLLCVSWAYKRKNTEHLQCLLGKNCIIHGLWHPDQLIWNCGCKEKPAGFTSGLMEFFWLAAEADWREYIMSLKCPDHSRSQQCQKSLRFKCFWTAVPFSHDRGTYPTPSLWSTFEVHLYSISKNRKEIKRHAGSPCWVSGNWITCCNWVGSEACFHSVWKR